jgi:hypothetical protein
MSSTPSLDKRTVLDRLAALSVEEQREIVAGEKGIIEAAKLAQQSPALAAGAP